MKNQMKNQNMLKGGYYTVRVESELGIKIPCVVFATSNDHAAGLVLIETGYLASEKDVEGPFARV